MAKQLQRRQCKESEKNIRAGIYGGLNKDIQRRKTGEYGERFLKEAYVMTMVSYGLV